MKWFLILLLDGQMASVGYVPKEPNLSGSDTCKMAGIRAKEIWRHQMYMSKHATGYAFNQDASSPRWVCYQAETEQEIWNAKGEIEAMNKP